MEHDKALLTFTHEIAKISEYLDKVAHVEAFQRIRELSRRTLWPPCFAHATKIKGSKRTCKIGNDDEFFGSYPPRKVIGDLIEIISREGATTYLAIRNLNKFKGGRTNSKCKSCTSLKPLPLILLECQGNSSLHLVQHGTIPYLM